jgi:hypothetical protein
MTMVLAMISAAHSIRASTARYSALVQQVTRALDHLERGLRGARRYKFQECNSSGQSYAYGTNQLGFASPLDDSERVVTGLEGRVQGQRWVVYYVRNSQLLRATSTDQGPFEGYMPPSLQRGLMRAGAGTVVARDVSTLTWSQENLSLDLVLMGAWKSADGKTLDSVAFERQIRVNGDR